MSAYCPAWWAGRGLSGRTRRIIKSEWTLTSRTAVALYLVARSSLMSLGVMVAPHAVVRGRVVKRCNRLAQHASAACNYTRVRRGEGTARPAKVVVTTACGRHP